MEGWARLVATNGRSYSWHMSNSGARLRLRRFASRVFLALAAILMPLRGPFGLQPHQIEELVKRLVTVILVLYTRSRLSHQPVIARHPSFLWALCDPQSSADAVSLFPVTGVTRGSVL